MSDSEASDFRFDDGSDSDDYVQPAKGKKAAPAKKAAAPKANKVSGERQCDLAKCDNQLVPGRPQEGRSNQEGPTLVQEEPPKWLSGFGQRGFRLV
jgi:hypothetical protein